jgi:hypothetical protein
VAVAGVTAIDTNVAVVTVNAAVAVLPPKVAVMSDVPLATPMARPVVGATVATPGVPEVQVEDVVTSLVDPSAYVAVAANCWTPLIEIEAVAGVIATESKLGTGAPKIGLPPPHPATKAINSNDMNNLSCFATLLKQFICLPLFIQSRKPPVQSTSLFRVLKLRMLASSSLNSRVAALLS